MAFAVSRAIMDMPSATAGLPPSRNHARHRGRWNLDRPAFEALLLLLGPDRESAGRQYEHLRRGLVAFFARRRDGDPEEVADETLDRLVRCISDAQPIEDVTRFAYGIARRVLLERHRRHCRRERLLRHYHRLSERAPSQEPEDGLECVRRCAARLPAGDRELILAYYQSGGRELQHDRKALADRFSLSPNALRLRVYRIRRILQAAVRDCLGGVEADPDR
jgi:DNA-directed RNA polymerase specialized sigma24 family protein